MTRTQRASAGAMLLAEGRAKKRITSVVDEITDHMIAQVARKQDRERVALTLLAVAAASRMLADRIGAAIFESRQDTRIVAAKRLGIELVAAGIVGVTLAASRTGPQEDHAYADSAAQSLAAAWGGLALASAARAAREEASIAKALDGAATLLRPRIERTAVTETARAYNAEHAAALREVAAAHPRLFEDIAREWRADMDRRPHGPCTNCASLHGQIVGAGEEFDDGDPPVHSNCRCFVTIVSRSRAVEAA